MIIRDIDYLYQLSVIGIQYNNSPTIVSVDRFFVAVEDFEATELNTIHKLFHFTVTTHLLTGASKLKF